MHSFPDDQLISALLNSQPDSVVWFRPVFADSTLETPMDFTSEYCNDASLQILEIPRSQVLGSSLLNSELMDKDSVKQIFTQCCQVWESGKPLEFTYYSPGKNKHFNVQRSKVYNGVLSITRDRTNEVTAENERLQQSELLNSLISNSPYGIVLYNSIRDENGNIQDFIPKIKNLKSAEFVGLTEFEIQNKTVKEVLALRGNYDFYYQAVEVLESGISKEFEYYSKFLDKWLFFTMVKFGDGILVNNVDITTTKKLQVQLEKIVEELRRSNSNLEEFAYAASHDLQEPIRKIDVFSDKLKKLIPIGTEADKIFDKITSATSRMRNLINGLLSYSKVNNQPEVFGTVNLNEIVENVLNDLEVSISETNAKFKIDILPTIMGDARQMRQLFQNLISNGLKYRNFDIAPVITITNQIISNDRVSMLTDTIDPLKEYFLIEVADNGIGFEKKNAEKIFNVFQRLHSRSEYEGTGVGLAIVQKVINNHKGFITADSLPGLGATFKVVLPA